MVGTGQGAGPVYYDSRGNVIPADEYLRKTGRAPSTDSQPASTQVSPGKTEAPAAEPVPASGKSSPETPPAVSEPAAAAETPVVTEVPDAQKPSAEPAPIAPAGAAKSEQLPPPTETAAEQPAAVAEKPEPASAAAQSGAGPEREPDIPFQATITSNTIFRAFQRDTAKKNESGVYPMYEYLQIDLETQENGWSLHTYGWGRFDAADSEFYHDNPDGELLYGYMEYNRRDYGLNFKLGRQHVFDGIINSSIDGVGAKSILTPFLNLSLYGGVPVALSSDKGRSGDSFVGGRIAGHIGSRYEIGLSYKLENSDSERDGEMVGIDLSLALARSAYIRGLSAYNLDTSGWGQHLLEAGLDVADVHFRPVFERYQYDDFFNKKDNSADPFRFLAGTNEILTVVGSDIIWKRFSSLDIGAKVSHYSYDKRNDNAMYYEGNLTWYVNGLSQLGAQLGRMDGGTSESAYFIGRTFFYLDQPLKAIPLGFITGDVQYVLYDQEIFGQDHSLFFSLGTGAKFFNDTLQVKLSGDYSIDPYFDSDFRVMLSILFQKNIQKKIGQGSHAGTR